VGVIVVRLGSDFQRWRVVFLKEEYASYAFAGGEFEGDVPGCGWLWTEFGMTLKALVVDQAPRVGEEPVTQIVEPGWVVRVVLKVTET
jgi:hypothetical protein